MMSAGRVLAAHLYKQVIVHDTIPHISFIFSTDCGCSHAVKPSNAPSAAAGLCSVPKPESGEDLRSWKPFLRDVDAIPHLASLNAELADALAADRATAREELYNRVPSLLDQSTTQANPIMLQESSLAVLSVRSASNLQYGFTVHTSWRLKRSCRGQGRVEP
jgi:hypothetical protein